MPLITLCLSYLLLFMLSSCAPMTIEQVMKEGKVPVPPEQIHSLISGAVFHLEAIDFDAKVHFLPGGQLSAKTNQGTSDHGQWSISDNKQLCLKFSNWYYSDIRCYTLIENKKDNYIFFTGNGARYYTGEILQKSPSLPSGGEENRSPKDNIHHSSSGSRQTIDRHVAERHTLIQLARNCRDCNLSGVDLRNANLITADLAGADLSGADLSGANLRRANLAGADLSGAKLLMTNLSGTNLTGCNLQKADLTGSNLIYADFTDAKLDGAVFTSAHFEHTKGIIQ